MMYGDTQGLYPRAKTNYITTLVWVEHVVLLKAGRWYGRPFKAERVVTQGDHVSHPVFNIVVVAVLMV